MADLIASTNSLAFKALPQIKNVPDGLTLQSDIPDYGDFIPDAAEFLNETEKKAKVSISSDEAMKRFRMRGKKTISHRHLEAVVARSELILPMWDKFSLIVTGTRWIDDQGHERLSFLVRDSSGKWVISYLRLDTQFGHQDGVIDRILCAK